jgi:hypothetical protein
MVSKNTWVLSVRLPDEIRPILEAKAKAKGYTLGEYVKDCLCRVNPMNETTQRVNPIDPSKTLTPVYNPAIHKSGDHVVIRQGKEWVETVVPEQDASGYKIYEE